LISHKYLNHGMKNVPIHNNSNSISPLLSKAGRMIIPKVVTTRRTLNIYLIGLVLFIFILEAMGSLRLDVFFTPDAFCSKHSIFALSLPQVVAVKFYENAEELENNDKKLDPAPHTSCGER